MGQTWAACDPQLSEWLEATTAELTAELGQQCVGVYLHGSLASGAFYPPKSDVDLLLVSASPLDAERRATFADACVRLHRARPHVGGLECSVLLATHVANPIHPMPFEVHFGSEWVEAIESGAVDHTRPRTDPDLAAHCQAMNEFGVALHGPAVSQVFGPIRAEDFIDSVRGDLEWITTGDNLLESPVYGVLNCCRVLWLWSGHSRRLVPTKEEAAVWAMDSAPSRQRALISEAVEAYRDGGPIGPEERQTAGREWSGDELRAFRDWMTSRWEDQPDWVPRGA